MTGSAVTWVSQVSPAELDFAKQGGLLPAVVQDSATGAVLMLGYLDPDALSHTLDTGLVTFHSRSRGTRWVKGETSGNVLQAREIRVDCDRDTLLILATPAGPTCHTGATSCFDGPSPRVTQPGGFLAELDELIASRHADRPSGSYTTSLFEAGTARIAQKVGEEGVETALAAVTAGDAELTGEAADLIYHLVVLLRDRGLGLADVERVLVERHAPRT